MAGVGIGAVGGEDRLSGVSNRWLTANIGILDAILMNVGYLLGFLIKFGSDIPNANLDAFFRLCPWIGIMSVISFWLIGGYDDTFQWPVEVVYNATLGAFLTGIATMAVAFLTRNFSFPRTVFVLGFIAQAFILSFSRLLVRRIVLQSGRIRKVAVIGSAVRCEVLSQKMRALAGYGYQVTEMLDPTEIHGPEAFDAVDVVCVGDSLPGSAKERIIRMCLASGTDVYVVPDLYDILLHRAGLGRLDDLMILRVEGLSISKGQELAKRIFDVMVASALLIVLAPVMLIISGAIVLTSQGGPFYSQDRIGWRGKVFKLLKFRTMVQDAERDTGPVLTWEGDPRITKVGRILRRMRLDELPQLINVLRGDMSFVGPRPERPFFVDQFSDRIPDYRYRLQVKPGITGLAQIEGRYSTNPEDKLKYDLYYMRSFSFVLDLQIMLRTLKVALTPDRANGLVVVQEGASASDLINSDLVSSDSINPDVVNPDFVSPDSFG